MRSRLKPHLPEYPKATIVSELVTAFGMISRVNVAAYNLQIDHTLYNYN